MKGRPKIIDQWRPAQRKALVDAIRRGAKLAHVSAEFGISTATIKRIKQDLGIPAIPAPPTALPDLPPLPSTPSLSNEMRQLVRDTREFIDRTKAQDRPGYELAGMSELRKVITDLAKLTGEMDSSTTINVQINLTQVLGEVRTSMADYARAPAHVREWMAERVEHDHR